MYVSDFSSLVAQQYQEVFKEFAHCHCQVLPTRASYRPPATNRLLVVGSYVEHTMNEVIAAVKDQLQSCRLLTGADTFAKLSGFGPTDNTVLSEESVDNIVKLVFGVCKTVLEEAGCTASTARTPPNGTIVASENGSGSSTSAEGGGATTMYDVVGFVGLFSIALSLIPQIYKTAKSRKTEDLSFRWQFTALAGLLLSLTFALSEGLWPLYVPALLEFTFLSTLTGMKVHFEGHAARLRARYLRQIDDPGEGD